MSVRLYSSGFQASLLSLISEILMSSHKQTREQAKCMPCPIFPGLSNNYWKVTLHVPQEATRYPEAFIPPPLISAPVRHALSPPKTGSPVYGNLHGVILPLNIPKAYQVIVAELGLQKASGLQALGGLGGFEFQISGSAAYVSRPRRASSLMLGGRRFRSLAFGLRRNTEPQVPNPP